MEYRAKSEGNINDLLVLSAEELISAGNDGIIRLWDTKTGEQKS